jgi:hypothetical protein
LAQVRVVQHRFQQQRIRARHVEISAGARHGVDMHCHAETAALRGDIAKQEILERFVFGVGGSALAGELRVNAVGRGAVYLVEIERAQVRRFEFLGQRAAVVLALQGRRHHLRQVLGETWRHGFRPTPSR